MTSVQSLPIQQFLLDHHPAYRQLSEEERVGLGDFCLLWSVFEGEILGPTYTHADLLQIPEILSELGVLQTDTLAAEVAYFKDRYRRDGAFTPEFNGLHVRRTDLATQKVIREFLTSGPEYTVVDALQAVLLIIQRLRSNAFNGTKAFDDYRAQVGCFPRANAVLMFMVAHHPWLE